MAMEVRSLKGREEAREYTGRNRLTLISAHRRLASPPVRIVREIAVGHVHVRAANTPRFSRARHSDFGVRASWGIGCSCSEHPMRAARRFSRVSGRLALTTHQVTVR
jgi:hypothetical protein